MVPKPKSKNRNRKLDVKIVEPEDISSDSGSDIE